jgi:transaldolase
VIRSLTAEAINVNVTLLFSVERYAAVADAFIAGLEQRAASRKSLGDVTGAASLFLSRIDTLIDHRLESSGDADAGKLRGQGAIACAQQAYAHFRSRTESTRWRSLSERGARPQRLLWASTGTKNPSYSDVKYVEALIGPDTITTLPLETLAAYRDHGQPALRLASDSIGDQMSAARELIRRLAAVGIDLDSIAQQLEDEGIKKFVDPLEATLAVLRVRLRELRA